MKKSIFWFFVITLSLASCGRRSPAGGGERIITVTIPPFAWFAEEIGSDDFRVNVLLPPGADHHIWEPLPAQINALSGSEAFIMNGQLGFEHAWMDRFMQVNPDMKILDLSRNIQLIGDESLEVVKVEGLKVGGYDSQVEGDEGEGEHDAGHAGDGDHAAVNAGEGHEDEDHAHFQGSPDPHYWMSPEAARTMAKDVRDFLAELNPSSSEKYDANLSAVNRKITEVDSLVRASLGPDPHRTVMIFHPALAYMGRDYGFEQVSFEDEGKSPSPARMKELIDLAREKEIKIIFIQAEYDVRNAQSLSRETGAELVVINPMNSNWPEAVLEVAKAIGNGQ
jgi:zinc transport system substrate-binding protein